MFATLAVPLPIFPFVSKYIMEESINPEAIACLTPD
jgi:hypothetical protein